VTQKRTREAFDASKPQPKTGEDRETDVLANKLGQKTSLAIRAVKTSGELVIDLEPTQLLANTRPACNLTRRAG
jgi:hypothetical protein